MQADSAIQGDAQSRAKSSGILRYMVQLDGLRAIAVFAVLIHHFLPKSTVIRSLLPWGSLGVHLFFVLSGFLITGILLRCRDLIHTQNQDAKTVIRNFYLRRFLRIWPIYYLTLLVATAINVYPARSTFLWHFVHSSNLYVAITGEWIGSLSHFWSLSLEEQFYLVWPWLILSLPQNQLLRTIGLTIAIGPLFRLLSINNILNETQLYAFPLASLDSLGMGALLALCTLQPELASLRRWLCRLGLWVAAPLFLVLQVMHGCKLEDGGVGAIVEQLLMALFFLWLVARTARGFKGPAGAILGSRPLVYVGKISYGVYLYHAFVHEILPVAFTRLHLPYPSSLLLQFILQTGVTLLLASASWYWIEKPISHLKHRFEYSSKS